VSFTGLLKLTFVVGAGSIKPFSRWNCSRTCCLERGFSCVFYLEFRYEFVPLLSLIEGVLFFEALFSLIDMAEVFFYCAS